MGRKKGVVSNAVCPSCGKAAEMSRAKWDCRPQDMFLNGRLNWIMSVPRAFILELKVLYCFSTTRLLKGNNAKKLLDSSFVLMNIVLLAATIILTQSLLFMYCSYVKQKLTYSGRCSKI